MSEKLDPLAPTAPNPEPILTIASAFAPRAFNPFRCSAWYGGGGAIKIEPKYRIQNFKKYKSLTHSIGGNLASNSQGFHLIPETLGGTVGVGISGVLYQSAVVHLPADHCPSVFYHRRHFGIQRLGLKYTVFSLFFGQIQYDFMSVYRETLEIEKNRKKKTTEIGRFPVN